jgi:hypothetical protein
VQAAATAALTLALEKRKEEKVRRREDEEKRREERREKREKDFFSLLFSPFCFSLIQKGLNLLLLSLNVRLNVGITVLAVVHLLIDVVIVFRRHLLQLLIQKTYLSHTQPHNHTQHRKTPPISKTCLAKRKEELNRHQIVCSLLQHHLLLFNCHQTTLEFHSRRPP